MHVWCRFIAVWCQVAHPHCAMVLLVLPPADHLWIGKKLRANLRINSAMQIDD
jgi:hypothetical protein